MENVICMKWGDKYGPRYVNILSRMVARNLSRPHRFICFTDDPTGLDKSIEVLPLPACKMPDRPKTEAWAKIGLFNPAIPIRGTTLFLDLDLVITAAIDPFFEVAGDFCIIHNWTHPDRRIGNSSVFRFEPGAHNNVYDEFNANPDFIVSQFRNEQIFVSSRIDREVGLTWWPAEYCKSFTKHSLPRGSLKFFKSSRVPENCRILVFHGSPNPAEAARNWRYGKPKPLRPFKLMRPAPWIEDYWHEG
jgi:hypothetical protein